MFLLDDLEHISSLG